MESQPQNPEFRNNPENFTHVFLRVDCCELPLMAVVRNQFLPCNLGPP